MAKKAFTLVEILIVVAIIGLLAAVGIPSFIGARQGAEDSIKEINISAVNAAKEQWAVFHNQPSGTSVTFSNIAPYVGNNITNISQLDVGCSTITIGDIGTSASYD